MTKKDNENIENIEFDKGNVDLDTILQTLHSKDKLIVSLKEAATRRDKLNERQIRTLSEDNAKKLMQMRELHTKLNEAEALAKEKEAQLKLFKLADEKLTSRLEKFRAEFNTYREQVRSHLDKIKISIDEELAKREEYKNKIVEQLKESYIKLENRLNNLDKFYKGILSNITKKQTIAKKYIRHALNDLQEALGLLDLGQGELAEPTKIKDEFIEVKASSEGLFKEFKELKGLPSASTIVKNIENVNISLGKAPQIENIFNEIEEITSVLKKNVKARRGKVVPGQAVAQGDEGGVGQAGGGGLGGPGSGSSSDLSSASSGNNMTDGGGSSEQNDRGREHEKQSKDKESGQSGESSGSDGAESSSDNTGKTASSSDRGGDKGSGGKQGTLSDERSEKELEDKKKKDETINEDVQEVIFKRNRNYAPFNWREILNDIQLKRFESFIESCIKAEKEGNYIKALGLYKTIQEQPGIKDSIAGKILDDHIEYLEDLIKRRYSNLPNFNKK